MVVSDMTEMNWDSSVREILNLTLEICFSTKKGRQDPHVAFKLGKKKDREGGRRLREREREHMRIPAKQELCARSMDVMCGD